MSRIGLLLACTSLFGAVACATGPAAPVIQAGEPGDTVGYLAEPALRVLADAVPAPAPEGSSAATADIAASDRLRALENGDRWLLATRHAELRPALALAHFECALGFRLSAEDSPRLVSLLGKVLHDANEAAELAKARAFRPRPVGVDPERPACTVVSAAGRASPSYPSGSASVGSAYGRIMAALSPDEAPALIEIGHQIGVSRMVCAMHYPADVAAGEALGASVATAIMATPAFASDAVHARADLEVARAIGATSPSCAAERAALATPLP